MTWKPISDQIVVANVDGKVRQLLVTAWDSYTGAIKVDWPRHHPALVSANLFSHAGKTKIAQSDFEPLDPDSFRAATSG
jgi:hypothetical protein